MPPGFLVLLVPFPNSPDVLFVFAGSIMSKEEEEFARELQELAAQKEFSLRKFENVIDRIRACVAEVITRKSWWPYLCDVTAKDTLNNQLCLGEYCVCVCVCLCLRHHPEILHVFGWVPINSSNCYSHYLDIWYTLCNLICVLYLCCSQKLWELIVEQSNLISHLRTLKDFFLLGRGELMLAFIDQAHNLLKGPPLPTSQHGMVYRASPKREPLISFLNYMEDVSNKNCNKNIMKKVHFNLSSKTKIGFLTLRMLRLLSSITHGYKDFWKTSKTCHVGFHWIALTEYSQVSTHVPGFQSFLRLLHHFVLAKLTTSSIRVKWMKIWHPLNCNYRVPGP